jgi:hypothetical protein
MKLETILLSCMCVSVIAGGASDVVAQPMGGSNASGLAGPVIGSTCGGAGVGGWLSSSHSYASAAANRLDSLASMSTNQRISAWNAGGERRWFGDYSELRFGNVRKRMRGISETLGNWRLDVRCNWSKSYYGTASPGIYRITLGSAWKNASGSLVDKPQTFVHEAAHIKGAVLGGEVRGKYGVSDALTRAQKYPGVAVRTAENLGYYAVCRSSAWSGKGGCPSA